MGLGCSGGGGGGWLVASVRGRGVGCAGGSLWEGGRGLAGGHSHGWVMASRGAGGIMWLADIKKHTLLGCLDGAALHWEMLRCHKTSYARCEVSAFRRRLCGMGNTKSLQVLNLANALALIQLD